jgi:hypothetical protein
MAAVGCISISSSDPQIAELISAHLDQWLRKEKWHSNILILKNSAVLKKTAEEQTEIVFSPGEYQSNPAKLFRFSKLPDLKSLEAELQKWLYSVQS